MLQAYINYPEPHLTTHADSTCSQISKMAKPGQRKVRLDASTLSRELQKFAARVYRFGSNSQVNDMWLEIDFGDEEFERAVSEYVLRLVTTHYRRFRGAPIRRHCR